MKALVTGATGFIGGHLAQRLIGQGYHVRALARREAPELADRGVELILGDISDAATLRAATYGVEAVFHLAAARDVWGTPEAVYQQINVEGTRQLLDAAAESGVCRFVYCSSVGVARCPGNLNADETLPYQRPTSQVSYHRTKAEAERLTLDCARSGRLPALVVRPVITYGPGDADGMVTRLIKMLSDGRFVPVGNGRNHVHLAYVDDIATGMTLALERGRVGEVYILSGPAPIQMRTLIGQICELLGKQPPRIYIPTALARLAGWGMEVLRLGAGRRDQAPFITRDKVATLTVDRGFSHARASGELGYRPQVDTDAGLQRTAVWLQQKGSV
jgi:dihydroflavonol-4-reductase